MTRIYCIPGGGTPASVFFKWRPIFKGIAEIKTLDYFRDGKADPPLTVESIAETFFKKIKDELEGCEHYMFVSSCTGSLIEYELFRKIKAAGLRLPDDIIVFSAFSPDSGFYTGNRYICKENREYIKDIYAVLFGGGLFDDSEEAAGRCVDFLIETNIGESEMLLPDKDIIGTGCTYEQEIMLGFANNTISLLKVDWCISARYSSSVHEKCMIDSRLTVIHSSRDKLVPKVESEKWQTFAGGEYSFIEIDGDHNIITNNTPVCTEMISRLINSYDKKSIAKE